MSMAWYKTKQKHHERNGGHNNYLVDLMSAWAPWQACSDQIDPLDLFHHDYRDLLYRLGYLCLLQPLQLEVGCGV